MPKLASDAPWCSGREFDGRPVLPSLPEGLTGEFVHLQQQLVEISEGILISRREKANNSFQGMKKSGTSVKFLLPQAMNNAFLRVG
jgi:hypothetical protein